MIADSSPFFVSKTAAADTSPAQFFTAKKLNCGGVIKKSGGGEEGSLYKKFDAY